ncbi:DUF1273 domain-containing protein [Heyndrickxia sp. NPDC080065]|uniref:DUF1273 domain-containing protein n=1 Tax=Heyndrickxia sp. NPDC080065 TaxID=3390568 RepID=UPI003D03C907
MKVLSITGYKPFELGVFSNEHPAVGFIKKAIRKELVSLLENGLEWVLISGQLGVELWAADVVYELRQEYTSLKLAILTPFLQQEEGWKEGNKEYYEMILEQADFVESISKQPYSSPQQFRNKNKIFLHKSQGMLIVYDVQKEGSPKYIFEEAKRYQEQNKYDIRTIDFYDLQMIIEEEQWSTY